MAGPAPGISRCAVIGDGCREIFVPLDLAETRALASAGVVMAGTSDLRPPYEMGRPDPEYSVLLAVSAGTMVFESAGGRRELRAGTALLIPSGYPHRYWIARGSVKLTWAHLAPRGEWTVLPPEPFEPVFPGQLVEILPALARECYGTSPSAREAAAAWAELAAIELRRTLLPDDASRGWQAGLLAELWEKVDSDLGRPWRVDSMARELHLSRGHFTRLVRKHYGCSAQRYLARLRVRRALQLLRGGGFTLATVAAQVGYSSPFALSKACKKATGTSPCGRGRNLIAGRFAASN